MAQRLAQLDPNVNALRYKEVKCHMNQLSATPSKPPETGQTAPHPGSFFALWRGRAVLFVVALLTAFFFIITAIIVGTNLQPTAWDKTITHEIQALPNATLGSLLDAVSLPGFAPWNWIIVGALVLFMLSQHWFVEAAFTALAGLGGLLAEITKNVIARPRPSPDIVHVARELHSYSFPSGHVTGYAALYGFVLYLVWTLLPRGWLRGVLVALLAAMILLIGPSRVYMGQHWASDAIGGYALGFAYLLIIIQLYRGWLRRHPKSEASAVEQPQLATTQTTPTSQPR